MKKNDKGQEINFLEVMPIRYDRIPSSLHIILIWLFFVLTFCILHYQSYSSFKTLSAESKSLNSSLDKAISLLGHNHSDAGKKENNLRVVAISDESLNLNSVGFSEKLLALSENYNDKVWYTQISFSNKDKSLALEGDTISTTELNNLFSRLKEAPLFSDFQLILQDVMLKFEIDGMPSHKFRITGLKK
ncbi:MAG: hypothetical protein VX335_01895 [Pseudomonadota bacterium]|nr:hypothetical protein [Pseudomonadota bacterium]